MATVTVFNRATMKALPAIPGTVVISICDPGCPLDPKGWDEVLTIECDDIEAREEILAIEIMATGGVLRKPVPFNEQHARNIMSLLERNPTADVIVHCNAGVSRSVAVGRFISEETGRKLLLKGKSLSDQTANGHILRVLHRLVWYSHYEVEENDEAGD